VDRAVFGVSLGCLPVNQDVALLGQCGAIRELFWRQISPVHKWNIWRQVLEDIPRISEII